MAYIGAFCCESSGSSPDVGTMSNRYEIVEKNSNFTAENYKFYSVNTTNAVITVTLPTTVEDGDWIGFIDKFGTFSNNNLVISNGSNTIRNNDGNLVVDLSNIAFKLVYNEGNWNIFDMSVAIIGSGTEEGGGISSGKYDISALTQNWTAAVSKYYLVSASSALTIALPPSPANGDWFIVSDRLGNFGTYNLTVAGVATILGNSDGIKLDVNRAKAKFVYYNGNWDVLFFS